MLTITDNAKTVIRRLITRADGSQRAGLRIGPKDGSEKLGVEIAASPEPGDAIVENGGARAFIEANASSTLAEKELDAVVADDSVEFTLRDRMRLVP